MTIGIREDYRNFGLGKKLLRHTIKMFTKLKCDSVRLHCEAANKAAVSC